MKTLAIVIGNSNYYEGSELPNAINDSSAIKSVFERLGYEVHYFEDMKDKDCMTILKTLDAKIGDFDANIFYYSGHGFEQEGENYLPSTECQVREVQSKYDLLQNSISLNELMEIYSKHPNKINIVILDACRIRFPQRGEDSEDVFTKVNAPKGTLIAFSTTSSKGASDGKEKEGNSPFTRALLQYIGREQLSVEDLFKKVRKTVYAWTNGKQVTWEHTSLIGDFYFNVGQMVYDVKVPYSENAAKDAEYDDQTEIGRLLQELSISDWNRQNPAFNKLKSIQPSSMNRDQQFIFGRNICQACGFAFDVSDYCEELGKHLLKYSVDGVNHVLNGMLYEMYFDSHGEYRHGKFKNNIREQVFGLRKDPRYKKSFEFIAEAIKPYSAEGPVYIPSDKDIVMDVVVQAKHQVIKYAWGEEEGDVIESVKCGDVEFVNELALMNVSNETSLKDALANLFCSPINQIKIHSNIELKHIKIPYHAADGDLW